MLNGIKLIYELKKRRVGNAHRNVGWAMPTDHLEPKQQEFKLFDSITYGTLRDRAISSSIDRY
jgi:hypothetical protein